MAAAPEVGAPVTLTAGEQYILRAVTEAMEKQGKEWGPRMEDAMKQVRAIEEKFGHLSKEATDLRAAIKEHGLFEATDPKREEGADPKVRRVTDPGAQPVVDPKAREAARQYRIGAAAIALARFRGNEDAAAEHLKKRGLEEVIPLIHSGERELAESKFRAGLSTLTEGAGGAIVPNAQLYQNDFIDYLRPQVVMRRKGVPSIPNPTGEIDIGRQNSTAAGSWTEDTTSVNASTLSVGRTKLVARKYVAIVPVSNDLIRRSIPSAEMIVQRDLVRGAAVEEDLRFLRGTGASSTPKGIRYLTTNTVNSATGAASPTFAQITSDITKMINQVASSKVPIPVNECGFITNNRTKWAWSHAQDGVGRTPLLEMLTMTGGGNLLGFGFDATEQVPGNLGGGSNEAEVYFGNYQELYIGDSLSFAMEMSREAAYADSGGTVVSPFSKDESVFRIVHEVDFTARYTTAWSVINAVTAA